VFASLDVSYECGSGSLSSSKFTRARENLRAHLKLLLRLCYSNNNKHSGDFIIRECRTHEITSGRLAVLVITRSGQRASINGMAMSEALVLLYPVSTGSKPYAPGRKPKSGFFGQRCWL
jgi:hypothetical protein